MSMICLKISKQKGVRNDKELFFCSLHKIYHLPKSGLTVILQFCVDNAEFIC